MSTLTTMRGWSALALIYPVFQYRYTLKILSSKSKRFFFFSKIMALASKRMSGGVCRVWMWTGSRVLCLTTLAGLAHPLVPGQYLSLLAFTHPNLLRWLLFHPFCCSPIPNCRLCPTPPPRPPPCPSRLLPTGKTGAEATPADLRSPRNR